MDFVQATGGQFTLGGSPFRIAGANCYYLVYESPPVVADVLDAAVAMGLRVIRTWAFPELATEERLDRLVEAAAARGLRLILPLINNWPDFGGMDAWVAARSLSGHDAFFDDPGLRAAYRDWAARLAARYRAEPAIMAWELANEPRASNPALLLDWMAEMSGFLKAEAPRHLVAAGDEGFFYEPGSGNWISDGSTGGDFHAILNLPSIDFGTFHLYPESWGRNAAWAERWIERHLDAAAQAGKPALLEEFGVADAGRREAAYARWLEAVEARRGAGALVWMLACCCEDGTPYSGDRYTLQPDSPGTEACARMRPA